MILKYWGTLLVSALPLDESQIARAAEEMMAEYGNGALTEADKRIKELQSEGFDSVAQTWEMIREAIKDVPKANDKIREYENALKKGVFLSE